MKTTPAPSRSRGGLSWIPCVVLLGCGAGAAAPEPQAILEQADAGAEEREPSPLPVHAEITAFVLAKCPHAAEALETLVALRREMGEQLSLRIGFIGLVDEAGNIDPRMGEAEIASALLQVCVSATSDEDQWLDYLGCVYDGDAWRQLPNGWEPCVASAGIPTAPVATCIASGSGETLLAQSYGAAAASGITGSPTVFVDGYLYGQGWDLDRMRQFVCHSAGQATTRPPLCASVAEPAKIEATLIYDPRCAGRPICDVEGEIAVLERLIPGFTLSRVPFSDPTGRARYEAVQAAEIENQKLPLVIIEDALDAQDALKALLGDYLLPFGSGYVFALGGGFDPLAEICDNGIDDNGDQAIDCADPGCRNARHCRESLPRRLDLFAMSECPYALNVLPHLDAFLDHFDRSRGEVDFNLQFIGDVTDSGFSSMHGESEVAEDLRMLCAQALYRKNYQYMAYLLCRATDIHSPAWEKCVQKGMSAKKIRACAEGKKGRALLQASFELAAELGITGSPTWLLNNTAEMSARRSPEMVAAFCKANPSAACDDVPAAVEPPASGAAGPAKCE